jgi:hypothetical protein
VASDGLGARGSGGYILMDVNRELSELFFEFVEFGSERIHGSSQVIRFMLD